MTVNVIEIEQPTGEDYRYRVLVVRDGVVVEDEGFDVRGDAECYARMKKIGQ